MAKMTQAEKFLAVRAEAQEKFLNLPEENVYQVAVGSFVVETENGWAKITVQAIKGNDYDPAEEEANYQFELEQKRVAREAKLAEKKRLAELKAKEKEKNQKVKAEEA